MQFTPDDPMIGPYHEDPRRIQEVVIYCGSRLRAAAVATVNAKYTATAWMESVLLEELVIFSIHIFGPALKLYF